MIVRASACTRTGLQSAFDQYAETHSQELAVAALERSTGARDVASVPDHRIVNALTELICGYSFVGKAEKKPANIHEALASIREKAFARTR